MAYELRTFSDIVSAVMEELKYQTTDTASKNRIKRDINMVYINEVVPYEQWKWLRGYVDVYQEAYFSTGTASVELNSNTVTLSQAPALSRKNQWFTVDGFNEVYRIAQHTAASTTVVLDSPFAGSTNTEASFRIWTDKLPLPVGLRDTVQVTHNFIDVPLENMGLVQYRKYVTSSPKCEGRPRFYTTSDYVDPDPYSSISGLPASVSRSSSGLVKSLVFNTTVASYLEEGNQIEVSGCGDNTYNGKWTISDVTTTSISFTGIIPLAESSIADTGFTVKLLNNEADRERYKELWVYPSLYSSRTTLHVDYVQEVKPLDDDDDEPLMPIGDRTILLYGALMRAWSRERVPEEASRNQAMYERKLLKMAGKLDDSTDFPVLTPSKMYLAQKRRGGGNNRNRYIQGWGNSGASSSSTSSASIINDANSVAIFDSSGELDASPTISTTELNYLDGVTSNVQTQLDALNTLADGKIYLGNGANVATEVTLTGDVTTTNAGVMAISAGVIVDADINASAAIAFSKMAALTASKLLESSAGGVVAVASSTGYPKLTAGTPAYSSTIPRADIAAGTNDHVLINSGAGAVSSEANLAIARGGTNAATAIAAFDNLAPTTTKGDLITRNGSNNIRLGVGTDNFVLTADSAQTAGFKWAAVTALGNNQSYEISNLGFAITTNPASAHTMVIDLKTKAGTNPSASDVVYIGFRNVTATTGTYTQRSVTAALTMTVSSGSTLGTISGLASYLYIYAVDNAGTVELGISHTYYDEGTVLSTTAEGAGGAADSNSPIYTTTARTSVPIRCIGRIKISEAAAGTWDTAPTELAVWPFLPQRVIAIYETDSTNGASNATATTVDFEDRVVDTHGAVTTGTWVFTAPKAMVVHVDCVIQLASIATWTAAKKVVLIIQKNGSNHRQLASFTSEGTTTMSIQLGGSCLVSMASGDTIRAQWTQDTGNGVNLDANATHNYICIMEHSFV